MIRIALDTNVLMSGIFWSGPPYQILKSWQKQKIKLVISPDILEEYRRVGDILFKKYPTIDIKPIIDLIVINSELCETKKLNYPISKDPDDDKFIAVCLATNCKIIVSGDKDLLEVVRYNDIVILKPNDFVNKYLL